ncbi:MAG: patatin-like phospholipase family protein [Caldisericaceae bacterium]
MKIGLVLSGGGARGLAHVGVLKAFEEFGIKPHIITGASMGGIIGALYAFGYSANDLKNLLEKLNIYEVLESKGMLFLERKNNKVLNTVLKEAAFIPLFTRQGLDSGRKIRKVFRDLTEGKDFSSLKIPFACVAVDLITEKLVPLTQGKLYEVMYATGAIPPYLEPLSLNGMLLADGGILNNAPVDLAREMGANVVIVIDVNFLQTFKIKENFRNAFDVILRVLDITLDTLYIDDLAKADYIIHIPLTNDIFDFESKNEIVEKGYQIAKENIISKNLPKLL